MARGRSIPALVLGLLLGLVLLGSPLPVEGQETPAPATEASRLDRLEKELQETRAELDRVKAKQDRASSGGAAAPAPDGGAAGGAPAEGTPGKTGPPNAAAQGEKFQKRFGKDGFITWNNGFSLLFLDDKESDPEKRVLHRFGVSGRAQIDYRAFEPDSDKHHPQNDRFFVRRGRITISGTYWKYHDFIVEFDLGQFATSITEAWINLGYWKEFQVRVGQFKEPMSLERIQSSRYLHFIERAMAKRWLNIDFDIGVQLHGDLGWMGYQLAVQNGTSTGIADNNDDKDVSGRIVLTPFRESKGHIMEHLILGASANYGVQDNFVPTFRTEGVDGGVNPSGRPGAFLFFGALPATGRTQHGPRYKWGLEGRINIAPVTIQGEYTHMMVDDIVHGPTGNQVDVSTRGGYVDVLFMITGEEHPFSKRIVPKRNFNPAEGGWGAWQLGVRWDHVHVESAARDRLGAVGANEVNAFVFGVNWYMNPMLKMQFNYNRNHFNRPAANSGREDEDVFMVRLAMEF